MIGAGAGAGAPAVRPGCCARADVVSAQTARRKTLQRTIEDLMRIERRTKSAIVSPSPTRCRGADFTSAQVILILRGVLDVNRQGQGTSLHRVEYCAPSGA